jgi:electron transfer flavoprotein alpha subunit
MKIVVLVKQVPAVGTMRLDPATRRLQREGVPSEVSSFDIRALVRALELRDVLGGEVVALTMGPPAARAALVHCLALGADRAIHLVDPAFAGADTLATARALASVLRREGFDLVLCGLSSVDAETGQVGPQVSQLLDIVQVTGAHRLEIDSGTRQLTAERQTDDGYETVAAQLPALVTAAEDLAAERFATKAGREEAKARPIGELSVADLGINPEDVGAAGSPTEVIGLETVESTREARLIEGASVVEAAESLVRDLRDHGLLGDRPTRRDLLPAAPNRPNEPRGPAYWVLAEILGGEVRDVTLELLGCASELAGQRNGHVAGLLIGGPAIAEHADRLAAHGADIVYVADDTRLEPYTTDAHATVVADVIHARQPAAVLFASTALGRDLAPRVAARLGLGLTGDCIDLAIAEDGRLCQYKPAFGGNVVARIVSRTRPDIATVRPGMLTARAANTARRVPWERVAISTFGSRRLRVVKRSAAQASEAAALDTAAVVVGVGKGIGGAEGLGLARQLATALEATLCATREVTDLGWLPRQYQVGLTGRAIAPRLYVAVAVRGAPEHVVGFRRAGFVVAINSNPKAPIFQHADRGIVADYAAAVPALITALKRRSGSASASASASDG